jgi:tetratricopeptide (TPR) repeat protein
MASFENELRSNKGFTSDTWVQAAQFALANNRLEKALEWSDYSINGIFVGQRNFRTLSTKAKILEQKGNLAEAKKTMQEALPLSSITELHQYGRQLITDKKPAEALEVFKLNEKSHTNEFTTLVGLTRGYSAIGDYKNALKYARLAAPLASDKVNKDSLALMLEKLAAGKDVN